MTPSPDIRAMRREQWDHVVAGLGRPPIGLASWDGRRTLGGWGATGPRKSDPITSVSLDHDQGGESRADPWVCIQTHASPVYLPHADWLADWVVTLRSDEWRPDERRRSKIERQVRSLAVREITLSVDGEAVPFAALGEDDVWAAYADHEGLGITVTASGIPAAEIELTSADPDAYLP